MTQPLLGKDRTCPIKTENVFSLAGQKGATLVENKICKRCHQWRTEESFIDSVGNVRLQCLVCRDLLAARWQKRAAEVKAESQEETRDCVRCKHSAPLSSFIDSRGRQRKTCDNCVKTTKSKTAGGAQLEPQEATDRQCVRCGQYRPANQFISKYGFDCKNCEYCRNDQRKYDSTRVYKTTPRTKLRNYKYGANRRQLEFKIDTEYFEELIVQNCHYCGLTGGGVDRIDSDEGYIPGNCFPCCGQCNRMKGAYPYNDFIQRCKLVSDRLSDSTLGGIKNV